MYQLYSIPPAFLWEDIFFRNTKTQIIARLANLGLPVPYTWQVIERLYLSSEVNQPVLAPNALLIATIFVCMYSQPDYNSGCDSARVKYFNGYAFYMIFVVDNPMIYHCIQDYNQLPDCWSFVRLNSGNASSWALCLEKMLFDMAYDAKLIYHQLDL